MSSDAELYGGELRRLHKNEKRKKVTRTFQADCARYLHGPVGVYHSFTSPPLPYTAHFRRASASEISMRVKNLQLR